MAGLEFLKDNKALVTATLGQAMQGGQAMMLQYDVLEGGRLSLTSPQGYTELYKIILGQDELELSAADGQTHRYGRVPAGQSMADAAKALQARRQAAMEALVQVVHERLQQPDLLLRLDRADGAQAPGSQDAGITIALQLQGHPQHGYQGTAYHDGPRVGASPAQVKLAPQAAATGLTVQLALAGQTAPPTLKPWTTQGQFTLEVLAQADGTLAINGPLRLGATPMVARLVQDAAAHRAIVTQYEQEKAQLEALKAPLVDVLKDYAVLRGQAASANAGQPATTDQITLIRQADAQPPRWNGQILVQQPNGQSREYAFSNASVLVLDGAAELVVPGMGRVYRLKLDGDWQGQWQPNANQPGSAVTMQLVEATDKATFDARVAAKREAILSITPQHVFHGRVPAYGDRRPASPVALSLTVQPNGQVGATARYLLFRSEVTMQGQVIDTLTGPAIELRFKDIPSGQRDVRVSANMLSMQIRNQRWLLSPAGDGPTLRLTGQLQGGQGGGIEFQERTDTWRQHHQTLLADLLDKGVTLDLTQPTRRDAAEPFRVTLKREATGAIVGQLVSNGRQIDQIVAQATATGRPADVDAWPGLALEFTPPSTARNTKLRHVMELLIAQRDGRPVLTGIFYPAHAPQAETYIEFEPIQP